MIHIATRLLVVIFALLLVAEFVPGIEVDGFYTALVVAIILGVLNLIVRPIILLLTLPITLLTLGLFVFVVNAALFWFVATFIDGFMVEGFLSAFIGSLIVSVVSSVAQKVI